MSPQDKSGRGDGAVCSSRKAVEAALDEEKSAGFLLSHELIDELGPGDRDHEYPQDSSCVPARTAADSEQDSLGTTIGCAALTPVLSATPSVSPPMRPSWDWKTDVPEFVPCDLPMALSVDNDGGEGYEDYAVAGVPNFETMLASIWGLHGMDGLAGGVGRGIDVAGLAAAAAALSVGSTVVGSEVPELDIAVVGGAPGLVGDTEGEGTTPKTEEEEEVIRHLRARMAKLREVREDARREWDLEKQGLLREIARYMGLLTRYAIPLEEAAIDQPMPELEEIDGTFGDCFSDATAIASTLQSLFPLVTVHMQAEAQAAAVAAAAAVPAAPGLDGGSVPPAAPGLDGCVGGDANADALGRFVGAMADPAVSRVAEDLETLTESTIDDRALRAIQALPANDALEIFRKVNDLVQEQGGRCRNLSSILQSVCRKRERRSARSGGGTAAVVEDGAEPAGSSSVLTAPGLPLPEVGGPWLLPDAVGSQPAAPLGFLAPPPGLEDLMGHGSAAGDGDAAGAADVGTGAVDLLGSEALQRTEGCTEGAGAGSEAAVTACTDVANGAVPRHQAAADENGSRPEAGDAADIEPCSAKDGETSEEYWNAQRMAKAATRGFDLKQRGDRWELKLSMASLEPPLTEQGMGCYCIWLRARLVAFRQQHGVQPLRRCSAEVDFSGNGLDNQSVWMLLEVLAECEVQASVLKLYKNRISLPGVLALCEFIRANRCAGTVHEMHLSHNEIDDEGALELLRTLHEQRPRYPPRRLVEGQVTDVGKQVVAALPVWVRLNQNRVSDPAAVLNTLDAEGITYCLARNAQSCGPGKCSKSGSDCPLVHLYLFADQAPAPQRPKAGTESGEPAAATVPPAATAAPAPSREPRARQQRVWAPVSEPLGGPEGSGKEDSPERAATGEVTNARRKRSRKARQREA